MDDKKTEVVLIGQSPVGRAYAVHLIAQFVSMPEAEIIAHLADIPDETLEKIQIVSTQEVEPFTPTFLEKLKNIFIPPASSFKLKTKPKNNQPFYSKFARKK